MLTRVAGEIEHKRVGLRELLEESIALSGQALEPSRSIALNVQQMPWPVSDVWGDRDLLVSPQSLGELCRGIRRSRLAQLPGCGHQSCPRTLVTGSVRD